MAIRQNGGMRRADFVFCLGYDGSTAIVDGRLQRKYGALGLRELVEAGLTKQALCMALFDGDEAAMPGGAVPLQCADRPSGRHRGGARSGCTARSGVPEGVTKVTVV